MNMPSKRGRGRPIGSGKDDSGTLTRMADLILTNPDLRPTTAMKRILDTLNPSVIRRLQVKWRAKGARYLAQAHARRAVVPALAYRGSVAYSRRTTRQLAGAQRAMYDALGITRLALIQTALESPALNAARELMGSPAIQELQNSPAMQVMRELQASPAMQAMREIHGSPAMQAAREAALEIEKAKRMLGGGF